MMNRLESYKIFAIFICLASMVFSSTVLASPIHDAAVTGDVDLMETMIANGADVDERDVHGYTPLHLAIQEGYTELAKVLIANGADVNARAVSDGGTNVTPLYLSIILGRGAVESLLRDQGATGPQTPENESPTSPIQ
jgi:ankyrin repeat protein